MESTGAGRGVHFGASGGGVSRNRRRLDGGFCGGRHFRRRRLPKQATPRRRLLRRPPLPAAASPETGDASTAASAAAATSGGGVSRNRRRLDGGFRSGRRLSTHTKHTEHTEHTENVIRKHTGHTAKAHRLRSREALRKARMRHGVLRGAITGTPWCRSAPGARIHALCMYMPCPCTDRTPGLSPLSGTRPAVDPREHREIPNPPIQNALPATPCKRRSDAKRAPAPPIAL